MKKDRKEVIMGDIMLVVIDKEIEAGMEIREIDDDNHYVKIKIRKNILTFKEKK
ncbi:hypothetical protein [Leptotrichia trevisanii]|jgi:hypothetical protein|nr:hypothetical protein [Leptotrichia trevisanii]